MWPKVVRRICPVGVKKPWPRAWDVQGLLPKSKKKLGPLLPLLKMAKDPAEMKLTLLEVICERFPPGVDMDR